MQSMTGYSYIEDKTKQFSFSIEIKTLNTKYNECYTNVPRFLRGEESAIQTVLKKSFTRGKVELSIEVFDWILQRDVSINWEMAAAYHRELRELEKILKPSIPFSSDVIFQMEGVVNRSRTILADESRTKIFDSLDEVVRKVNLMRAKEGSALKKDIVKALKAIKTDSKQVQSLSKFDSREYYNKLKDRISAISGSIPDERRLYSEIAFYADKIDINEEICRLSDHLAKIEKLIAEEEVVGKKLDFLAQELFREINTIGSKTASSKVSHIVVEMKNNVDRIREQARNLV